MTGCLCTELISIILEPGKCFEHTIFNDGEWIAFQPKEITLEGEGFAAGGIIDQSELVREDLFPDHFLRQERVTAFH